MIQEAWPASNRGRQTDAQALLLSNAHAGAHRDKLDGAWGGIPEARQESGRGVADLYEVMKGTDMAFITAASVAETVPGAAPIIRQSAKEARADHRWSRARSHSRRQRAQSRSRDRQSSRSIHTLIGHPHTDPCTAGGQEGKPAEAFRHAMTCSAGNPGITSYHCARVDQPRLR